MHLTILPMQSRWLKVATKIELHLSPLVRSASMLHFWHRRTLSLAGHSFVPRGGGRYVSLPLKGAERKLQDMDIA